MCVQHCVSLMCFQLFLDNIGAQRHRGMKFTSLWTHTLQTVLVCSISSLLVLIFPQNCFTKKEKMKHGQPRSSKPGFKRGQEAVTG